MNNIRLTRWTLLGMLLLTLPLLGCGKVTGTVTGRVAHNGKALAGGTVTLVSEGGIRVTGNIKPDGGFKIDEVPVGVVKIAVKASSSPGLPPVLVPWAPEDGEAEASSDIPASYADADKSGLTLTVSAGPQTHDIDLP